MTVQITDLPPVVLMHQEAVRVNARRVWNTYGGERMTQRERLEAILAHAQNSNLTPTVLADVLGRLDMAADLGCHPDELED